MPNILIIKSSLNGEQGNSNKLAQELTTKLQTQQGFTIVERDLAKDDLAHLSQAEMQAWATPVNERSKAQQQLADLSDRLIAEVKSSDILVVAMPMYNFGVPSTFKAWADRVARAGVTFKYTEQGPVGLLENKQVIVLAARGGLHAGTDSDTQTAYLQTFFAFLGIEQNQFIYAEGLNMPGKEARFDSAIQQIKNLTL